LFVLSSSLETAE